MEKIVWDKKFNIGVEIVDKAHSKLFRIMSKLQEISNDPENYQHTYKEGVKYLESYTMTHFLEEESYMCSIRYKGYAQHKRIHDNFRDKTLVSLKRDMELSNYSSLAVQRFISTMNTWLTEHIMREDQAIVGKGPARKGYDFSSQVPVITRAVNRTLQDICQVEATLTSSEYKGQNIGNGFYFYQYYDMDGGIRLQILLGMEEALLLRGLSLIQGTEEKKAVGEAALRVFEPVFQNLGQIFQGEKEEGDQK